MWGAKYVKEKDEIIGAKEGSLVHEHEAEHREQNKAGLLVNSRINEKILIFGIIIFVMGFVINLILSPFGILFFLLGIFMIIKEKGNRIYCKIEWDAWIKPLKRRYGILGYVIVIPIMIISFIILILKLLRMPQQTPARI